ncbi:MAG: hypothetical protein GF334_13430 [Candidatus Altiarchaeales archaeon]|nr:hypothetical protein [Candidatus Altiarchaeales archaeon]
MARYAVVLPVSADELGFCLRDSGLLGYFLDREVDVYVMVNGPDALDALRFFNKMSQPRIQRLHLCYGGREPNPYPARNIGLRMVMTCRYYDAAVLMDADCIPEEGYHSNLVSTLNPYDLYAGVIKTTIPDTDTPHFNMLREIGFECYDGYRPDDICVGANMVIGKRVYELVGDMATKRSGGDADYSVRFKSMGGNTTPRSDLVVRKKINGMSLLGILRKQALRGASDPLHADASMVDIRKRIVDEMSILASRMTPYEDAPMTAEEYGIIVDGIFSLVYHLGRLAGKVDDPARSDSD